MSELTAAREDSLRRIADMLLDARRTGNPIENLPADLRPVDETEAFFVQDVMMAAYGAVGGWKIGARGPEAVPFFAPMPKAWMGTSGDVFRGGRRLYGVEAEIAFRMGRDLPPRPTPYTREEVLSAVESCHPAIEILESAYVNPEAVPRENMLADMQMHSGFVAGPAFPAWRDMDWATETVALVIDGSVRKERTGSNPGGSDLARLLMHLANEGAARTHGLRAGDWITTGSWTGADWTHESASILAEFGHAGKVGLRFNDAPESR